MLAVGDGANGVTSEGKAASRPVGVGLLLDDDGPTLGVGKGAGDFLARIEVDGHAALNGGAVAAAADNAVQVPASGRVLGHVVVAVIQAAEHLAAIVVQGESPQVAAETKARAARRVGLILDDDSAPRGSDGARVGRLRVLDADGEIGGIGALALHQGAGIWVEVHAELVGALAAGVGHGQHTDPVGLAAGGGCLHIAVPVGEGNRLHTVGQAEGLHVGHQGIVSLECLIAVVQADAQVLDDGVGLRAGEGGAAIEAEQAEVEGVQFQIPVAGDAVVGEDHLEQVIFGATENGVGRGIADSQPCAAALVLPGIDLVIKSAGDDAQVAVPVQVPHRHRVHRGHMAAHFLRVPCIAEGGAGVLPDVDLVIRPARDNVQVAVPVQVPHCHRVHPVRMAAHFLRVPCIVEGGAVVLPDVDLVIPPPGDNVQVAVPVQVTHRHRCHIVRMVAHFLLGPGLVEGGAVVLPDVDLVIRPAGDDVQVAVPVQVPRRHREHTVRATHFLLGPGPIAEGGAVVLPGVDLVIIPAGDDVRIAVPVQVTHRHREHAVRMAAHFLLCPGPAEGGAIVLPGVDLVVIPAGNDVQVAVSVQVPHRYRVHTGRMAAHFLLGPCIVEGGAVVLPGVDVVIKPAGDDVQVSVPVQVAHRDRLQKGRMAAHVLGGAAEGGVAVHLRVLPGVDVVISPAGDDVQVAIPVQVTHHHRGHPGCIAAHFLLGPGPVEGGAVVLPGIDLVVRPAGDDVQVIVSVQVPHRH